MSVSSIPTAIDESVLIIGPPGVELVGVLAQPAEPRAAKSVGVVIVVGGPQTRVGSHRQFVLMARAFAQAGYPCLRFDYTGMGDSPGPRPDFEMAGADIRRACDALAAKMPTSARLALWGLCDGATASLLYGHRDQRIEAVIAANPWARSDITHSAAIMSTHYGSRVRSAEFWKKLLTGRIDVGGALLEFLGHLLKAVERSASSKGIPASDDLPARLAQVLTLSTRPIRLQLSGRDLTAAEFEIAMKNIQLDSCRHVSIFRIATADHTYSDPENWAAAVADSIAALDRL